MHRVKVTAILAVSALVFLGAMDAFAQRAEDAPPSRYMGGPAELVTAPNGAIANAEVLEVTPEIMYLEPTIDACYYP